MSLIDDIQRAQMLVGEAMAIANLKRTQLLHSPAILDVPPVRPTPVGRIDYGVLFDFAHANCVDYNALCSAVRRSLGEE